MGMKQLLPLLIAVSAIAALPSRRVAVDFILPTEDSRPSTTIHVLSSTNLVDWSHWTNYPAIPETITSTTATTKVHTVIIEVVPGQRFFQGFTSNAWSISPLSEINLDNSLPPLLSGTNPVVVARVLP
jgi:hypothetical protein